MSAPIFISHSSRDRDWAYRLIADLEKRGIPCWISSRDIEPGADYQKSIVDALESAPAMVLLFSDHANNSKEIPREMAIASGKSKPMIPVRIEDVVPRNALEYSLTNAQFLDLFANYEETMSRLTESLMRQIAASQLNVSGVNPSSAAANPQTKENRGKGGNTPSVKTSSQPKRPGAPTSNKKIYMGVGAVGLLAAVVGAFTLSSHEETPTATTVVHSTIAHDDAAASVAKPAPVVVEKSPPSQPSVVSQAPSVKPMPTVSAEPEKELLPGSLDALVASAKLLSLSNRAQAIQQSPLLENQKLSAEQMLSLLNGTINSDRSRLIDNLLPFTQQPIPVADALKLLNLTGDSWVSTVRTMEPALPDELKADEILALLGKTLNSDRFKALEILSPKGIAPFDLTIVEKILRPMNDSRVSAIRNIVHLLPQPLPESSYSMLLTSLINSDRQRTLDTLQPVLGETLTLSGALKLLENTNDSWVSSLATLASILPDNLTAAEGAQLLGRTQNSDRTRALQYVVPHLASGLKGSDAGVLLKGINDSWNSGLNELIPYLGKDQDSASVLTLLGLTKNSDRNKAIDSLDSLLPAKISVQDAVNMLNGTGDSRLSAAIVLLPHISQLSQQDFDALAGNMTKSERERLIRDIKQ